MNITLSADEALIARARECAKRDGTSLNRFIREQMKRLAEGAGGSAADEFLRLTAGFAGQSPKGYRFDRAEAHRR